MFCKKCGGALPEGQSVCPRCGEPVKAAPAVGPVEKARANPLFLAAVICLSVTVLFQLISLFLGGAAMGQMEEMLDTVGAGGLSGGVNALVVLVSLCALAISAVTLVGLWFVYVSGLSEDKAPMLDQGLKLTGVGVMAQMVYVAVVLGLAALVLLVGTIVSSGVMADLEGYYGGSGAAGTVGAVGAVAFLLVAGIGALMIVFYLKAHKAVNIARSTAAAGTPTGLPSLFVAVMCFVLAGLSLLTVLFGSVSGFAAVVNALAGIGANVLFGIVLLQYRGQLQTA